MSDVIEHLDLSSGDIAAARRAELLRLFPEAATEGGKIDVDQLLRVLGETVDPGKERYGMNWPGKAECFKTIQAPSTGTLLPCPEESVNFDTTENLIIEGDNLEVLKLLQKSYLGKVKMIYIDPPYNTGNDFIYPDNYSESLRTYLEYTGQVDAEGRKFGTNTDADGRFHSKWMNMMYPRLYLARNLLSEEGLIVVSIDDAELAALTMILDEVFGEDNEIATLVWDRNRKNDARFFSVGHEYMKVYAANKQLLVTKDARFREFQEGLQEAKLLFEKLAKRHGTAWDKIQSEWRDYFRSLPNSSPKKKIGRYTKIGPNGPFRDDGDISWPGGGGPKYEVIHPVTQKSCKIPDGGWRYPTARRFWEEVDAGHIVFGPDETTPPRPIRFLFETEGQVMPSVHFSYAQTATVEFAELMGDRVFENPKNWKDIRRLVAYVTKSSDLIVDFFAGSGTTGHGVLDANRDDGGNRKFILVQLPEPTGRADYPTIADITKERVRRVLARLDTESAGKLDLDGASRQDHGFRVFKLAESNFRTWNADLPHNVADLATQLELHVEHIRAGRTGQDILFELLLKSGFPLTTPVKAVTLAGQTVHSVAGGALLICLERELTLELIRAMAEERPERVVCLDAGFAGNDQLKANAVQIFKTKGVTSFKTV